MVLNTVRQVQNLKQIFQSKVYGKSVRDIAAEEGSDWTSVWESINAAEKRIEKELKKRGYNA